MIIIIIIILIQSYPICCYILHGILYISKLDWHHPTAFSWLFASISLFVNHLVDAAGCIKCRHPPSVPHCCPRYNAQYLESFIA